jgi:hypothetical protein
MDILQLKAQHPDEFAREHVKYLEYGLCEGWWECIYDNFREECARKYDLQVGRIWFSGFYSQGDGAAFDGRIPFKTFMTLKGFNEKYPALYLHAEELKATAESDISHRGSHIKGADLSDMGVSTYPQGAFALLSEEAWDTLVESDRDAEDWEAEVTRFFCDLADELYIDLRDEYEYLTSEEAFIESAEINELTYEVNK